MKTIIIEIRGGVLCGVFSSDPHTNVKLIDWDNAQEDEVYKKECEELEKQTKNMTEKNYCFCRKLRRFIGSRVSMKFFEKYF